jgi:hypothetical protein
VQQSQSLLPLNSYDDYYIYHFCTVVYILGIYKINVISLNISTFLFISQSNHKRNDGQISIKIGAPMVSLVMRGLAFYSHGKQLHNRIISPRGEMWDHKTCLTPSPFI